MTWVIAQHKYYILRRNKEKGFSLIELLVVVIILGVLSALALPNLFGQVEKARTSEAKLFLGSLNRTQQAYYFENGSFALTMSEMGSNYTTNSEIYDYVILNPPPSPNQIHHQANPKPIYANELNTLESAVYRLPSGGFTTSLCIGFLITDDPNITAPGNCDNGEIVK
ncbi:prepilin-type N-terminal cleavage/methylation domain-containing protein [Xenococcus sp. PCC 7305]|uniref:type IV pilin-like G/H family protein n=1 Tax=Xenococcus sp. PCC 7305 TaxID=102125 RepID=UPI0002AC152A|nr:type IV pilin-like G/H family protein [Xenococcus sp. PCC 7305]ELS01332.1 prepilin-type N-terminal cleavage/methylation domain-containing protein [Xenococcus sp. PCC 7305]